MDIFQQLLEYESQKKEKRLWEGEKAVLIWAGSDQHQHLGSAIGNQHAIDALNYCEKEGFISSEDKTRLLSSVEPILKSLAVHEFGQAESNPAQRNDLKINRNGILAGKILIETNNLKNTKRYDIWVIAWWLLFICAGSLLVSPVLKDLYKLILD